LPDRRQLTEITADIVSAYVGNNAVRVTDLPDLIASVSGSVSALGQPQTVEASTPAPAVNPKRSVFPDYLVCLEDGKKFKSLKRHLSAHGMTPDEYRRKWGLPADYPMVAPNYSAARSQLAKKTGLGRKATARRGRSTKGK
jgi:predicted transcriptional regulator